MGANTPSLAKPVDDGFLRGFWYPALRSSEIRGRDLRPVVLLNLPLTLGRTEAGKPFAVRDACPHRGFPFSDGNFDGKLLECCYHGWKFEPVSGQCREIPSLMPDSKLKAEKIYAKAYSAEENDGYLWVYVPDPDAPGEAAPPAPRLPVFSKRYKLTHLSADLPCHVDHGIIGLMDPAHGPFVHQAWWWRTRRSIREKQKIFEPIPNGFRMRAHSPSANSAPYKLLGVYGKPTTQIDFVLPNMRFEEIHCGDYWFSSRTTVTPVSSNRCRIDVCAAWNLFAYVPFVVPILRFFGNRFVDQDTQTMIKQARGLKHNPPLMLIDDADRPAKWYFALKAACQESRRSGQPMKHPIAEATTLRWRS